MAFKMKAGKEGPMKKNFPSVFKIAEGGSGSGLGARQKAKREERERKGDERRAQRKEQREERRSLRKSQRGERKDLKTKQKTTVKKEVVKPVVEKEVVKEVVKPEKKTKKTGTKKYSDLPADQRDAAKAYNMRKYGTHNPTARAKSLGITKAELAKRHSADEADTFAAKKRKNRDTKFM
tara:strand:- start:83 stop:619 length:537 start_codon:yes stop_codon:yes gene_type:complete